MNDIFNDMSSIKKAVRELLCQRCEQEYPVWFAPNELWSRVQQEGEHFFCPTCFAVLAEERGIVPTAWFLREETKVDTDAAGRVGHLRTIEPLHIVTDSLGFRLEVLVSFEDMDGRGRHKTYEQDDGGVTEDAVHRIVLNPTLDGEMVEVITHEAYHLFYSVRPLIAVDEETEATVFGQLVKHIHDATIYHETPERK